MVTAVVAMEERKFYGYVDKEVAIPPSTGNTKRA